MSGVQITVDAEQVQAVLARLQAAGQNLQPTMDRMGVFLVSHIRVTLVQQADPYGRAWPGLKPGTLRRRRMGGAGAQALRDTGRLMNSITHQATESEVVVGTNVDYAAIHNFGGTIQRKGRSGSVRLRTTAGGQLVRGRTGGAVFASGKHKRAVDRHYAGRDYRITIPARPFFPGETLPANWQTGLMALALRPFREAIE